MSPLVVVCAAVGLMSAGYLIGRVRPMSRLDEWAWRQVDAVRLTGRRGTGWWVARVMLAPRELVAALAPLGQYLWQDRAARRGRKGS